MTINTQSVTHNPYRHRAIPAQENPHPHNSTSVPVPSEPPANVSFLHGESEIGMEAVLSRPYPYQHRVIPTQENPNLHNPTSVPVPSEPPTYESFLHGESEIEREADLSRPSEIDARLQTILQRLSHIDRLVYTNWTWMRPLSIALSDVESLKYRVHLLETELLAQTEQPALSRLTCALAEIESLKEKLSQQESQHHDQFNQIREEFNAFKSSCENAHKERSTLLTKRVRRLEIALESNRSYIRKQHAKQAVKLRNDLGMLEKKMTSKEEFFAEKILTLESDLRQFTEVQKKISAKEDSFKVWVSSLEAQIRSLESQSCKPLINGCSKETSLLTSSIVTETETEPSPIAANATKARKGSTVPGRNSGKVNASTQKVESKTKQGSELKEEELFKEAELDRQKYKWDFLQQCMKGQSSSIVCVLYDSKTDKPSGDNPSIVKNNLIKSKESLESFLSSINQQGKHLVLCDKTKVISYKDFDLQLFS